MAHPKRQHSRQRQRKRRSHDGLTAVDLGTCSQCHKPVLPHRICPACGFYKGKAVVQIKVKEKEKSA